MAKPPKVSVLMPFYDNGSGENRKYFSEALSSVLGQSFKDFEIVLVASGAKDFAKKQSARSKKIRLFFFDQKITQGRTLPLPEKLHGIITARNMCLSRARGELVAFADFDDISLPGRLETQVRFLRLHPLVGAVGSSMILIDSHGREIGRRVSLETDAQIRAHFLQFNPFPQPTAMARLQLLRMAGGYRQGEIPEDYDLWVRMARLCKFHNLQPTLIKYRVHPGGGASGYKLELYLGALRVKWRAAKSLGLGITPKDVAVNFFHLLSVFVPNSLRRTVLEEMRSRLVIGK